jgi:hypothetical protein
LKNLVKPLGTIFHRSSSRQTFRSLFKQSISRSGNLFSRWSTRGSSIVAAHPPLFPKRAPTILRIPTIESMDDSHPQTTEQFVAKPTCWLMSIVGTVERFGVFATSKTNDWCLRSGQERTNGLAFSHFLHLLFDLSPFLLPYPGITGTCTMV